MKIGFTLLTFWISGEFWHVYAGVFKSVGHRDWALAELGCACGSGFHLTLCGVPVVPKKEVSIKGYHRM